VLDGKDLEPPERSETPRVFGAGVAVRHPIRTSPQNPLTLVLSSGLSFRGTWCWADNRLRSDKMNAGLLIAVAGLMGLLAWRKGFNPLLWLLAGGIPGALVLLFMPSANAEGLDDATKAKRRRTGNIVGTAITIVALILAVAAGVFLLSLRRRFE
jgi:hypothetical protein